MPDGFIWALLAVLAAAFLIWLALSIERAISLWRGQLEDDD